VKPIELVRELRLEEPKFRGLDGLQRIDVKDDASSIFARDLGLRSSYYLNDVDRAVPAHFHPHRCNVLDQLMATEADGPIDCLDLVCQAGKRNQIDVLERKSRDRFDDS